MVAHAEIEIVHLEVTSKCNASCPMCPRNLHGGAPNPNLPIHELSLADVTRIFEPSFVRRLKKIYLCGNFGDPAAATECLPILRYFREASPSMELGIHTNGGLRGADWWRELAGYVDYCRFAIDGLEDTNHLYRQGVRWSVLMRNVEAFISAGGVADWVFLVFKHNQHQTDEARRTSRAMGFRRFSLKTTSRFPRGKDGTAVSLPVLSPRGEPTHAIEPTDLAELAHPNVDRRAEVERRFGSFDAYLEECAIWCKAEQERSIYIDAGGNVLPCCWTAGELHAWPALPRTKSIASLVDRLPEREGSISALAHNLPSIVDGELFRTLLPEAWRPGPLHTKRLRVCAKICGDELRPFEGQFVPGERG